MNQNLVNSFHTSMKPVMEIIQDITAEPGREDAFFVCEVEEIIKKVDLWRRHLPRVRLFYAVKCNNCRPLLEILASLGTGFDCASKREIKEVLDLGVDSSRIVFAHPCKPSSHLRHASASGVRLATFDSLSELRKTKLHHPGAELVLRIRCDASDAQTCLGEKFGAEPEDSRLLLATARDLGLAVVGVSFHVGSGCREPLAFRRAIAEARKVFDEAEDEGFKLNLLDIGGGFPGDDDNIMVEYAEIINAALDQFFPNVDEVKVISEPGRFVATSAFSLATRIINKREMVDTKGLLISNMYYINDGVYTSFSVHTEGAPHPPKVLSASASEDMVPSIVWGQTCCSLDRVIDMQLPLDLQCCDWLVWPNRGAYSLTLSTSFNSFEVPEVYVVSTPKANERIRKNTNSGKNSSA